MKLARFILAILALLCCSGSLSIAQDFPSISSYQVSYALANDANGQLISIRTFRYNKQTYLLLVDPKTLNTKVDLARNYRIKDISLASIQQQLKNLPYVKSLQAATMNDWSVQNAGIDHAIPREKGINLTIDLCPSHKNLDRVIFQSLFDEFKKIEQPAPVAVSVSGKWMLKHQSDLNWLKQKVAQGELNITWINHSYNHEVNRLPLQENFLLAPGTRLDVEVLENEKLMLKNGLIPSVFFRFPGLVSDQAVLQKIEAYGLIPVGSDAWLAKGQKPNAGSIVLIHGNGNEETGVQDFIQLLRHKQADIKNKQWLLFDLRQGLEKEFE